MKLTEITILETDKSTGKPIEKTVMGQTVGNMTLHQIDGLDDYILSFKGFRLFFIADKVTAARKLARAISPLFDAHKNKTATELNADRVTMRDLGQRVQSAMRDAGFVQYGQSVRRALDIGGIRV